MSESEKLKKFSLIDALMFSLNLSTSIVNYSLIATVPGLKQYGILITVILATTFYILIELPSSLYADRFSWVRTLVSGQLLRAGSQLCFFFSVFNAINSNVSLMWFFLVLTTLLDSAGSSLTSGTYESAFIKWFGNYKSNLFLESYSRKLWARVLPSLFVILVSSVLIFEFKEKNPHILLIPVLMLFIGRFLMATTIWCELKTIINNKKDSLRQAFRGAISNFLRTSHQVLTFSTFKFFRLVSTGILINYLYKVLDGIGFSYEEKWFYGSITSMMVYYIAVFLSRILFPLISLRFPDSSKLLKINYTSIFILSSILIWLSLGEDNFLLFSTQVFLALYILVSSSYMISLIKGQIKRLIDNSYFASWISTSESFSIILFSTCSFIVYKMQGEFAVTIFSIATAVTSFLFLVFKNDSISKVKLLNFKRLMTFGFLSLFILSIAALAFSTLKIASNSLKASENKSLNVIIRSVKEEIKKDMLTGNFVEMKFKANEYTKIPGIDCIEIIYDKSSIFNNCKTKGNKNLLRSESINFQNSQIGRIDVSYNYEDSEKSIKNLVMQYFYIICGTMFFGYMSIKLLTLLLYREIKTVTEQKMHGEVLNFTEEFFQLKASIKDLLRSRLLHTQKLSEYRLAAQVIHDIKSPLAALDIVLDDLKDLPQDSRELTINALERIQQIVNNLSSETNQRKKAPNLISYSTSIIIKEKRVELSDKSDISIQYTDTTDYKNFTSLNSIEWSRIISNLINNASEALKHKGTIRVHLSNSATKLFLTIEDNGPGFPDSILAQPIKRGNTIGKKDGQGLGLYHAYESLSEVSGDIELKNHNGAIVTISIPKQSPPQWFCSSINFPSKIVICDDDKSIHDLWKKKLSSLNCEITHFYSADEFNNFRIKDNQLILMDFNLRSNKSGLDLVKEADLDNVIFVTSDFENIELQAYCINKHLKILPKYLISVI